MWKASREVTYSFFTTFSLQGRAVCPLFRIYQRWWLGHTGRRDFMHKKAEIFSLWSLADTIIYFTGYRRKSWLAEISWNERRGSYIRSLSLSLSSLSSFFPFAPFVFSLVFLIDCLKQTWFSLLCNFLFTSSIWVAFQCNIHKQQTL